MQTVWNLFFMFGGVAAMMLGMRTMGNALEQVAGRGMKKLLGKVTTNRFAGVGVGVVVTSIIQSSTATTVMLVGFVNIGLMTLVQATNVIMGANIGTTVTAHIVSLSGVGNVDIGAIAAMIGCIGILMAMLVKNEKVISVGNILVGLGMIFVGLEFISTYAKLIMFKNADGVYALDELGNKIPYGWVQSIFQGDHFPLLLILIGVIITALVHSSSTITSLMVVLASIGVLSFDNALFLALGSNIGTCITSILSSAGTQVNAKRTAIVHLLFNLFGCILFVVPLWIWKRYVSGFFASMSGDVGQQIAIFHTLFNVLTTAVLMPFTPFVVKLACKLVREKKQPEKEEFRLQYIDDRLLETPPIAVSITKDELVRMGNIARENLNLSVEFLLDDSQEEPKEFKKNEEELNFIHKAVTNFLTKLIGKDLNENDEKKVGSYYHVASDLERVGDYAENIIEYALKLREEQMPFSLEAKEELKNFIKVVNELYETTIATFSDRNSALLPKVEELEEKIDALTVEYENGHVERLKKGTCTCWQGSVYLKTLSHLERIGDHITNVAKSIKLYVK